jgi:CheY-like chemotaxis protein
MRFGQQEATNRTTMMGTRQASASFVRELAEALRRLYDPVRLRKSPLMRTFSLDQREDPTAALRRVLVNAIEALRPEAGVPLSAQAWRTYHVLIYRRVECCSQAGAAANLGLSIRQLRRDETLALQALAAYLWEHYHLGGKLEGPAKPLSSTQGETQLPHRGILTQELEWIEASLPAEPVDVHDLIRTALKVLRPLLQEAGIRADYSSAEDLPRVVVQTTVVRQALLRIITVAIQNVPGGEIRIETSTSNLDLTVSIRAIPGPTIGITPRVVDPKSLKTAYRLVALSGGSLGVRAGGAEGEAFIATLTLPVLGDIRVLVIDDNADMLQLVQRYLSGTRYRFIGVRDPMRALALAQKLSPHIVVMDVMLPEVDGWELLGRFRAHPQVGNIPVVLCSILPQEELALALGAADFISKPVRRQVLLSALDHQLDRQSKVSC